MTRIAAPAIDAPELRNALRAYLREPDTRSVPTHLAGLVTGVVTDALLTRGLVARRDDERTIAGYVTAMLRLVRMFSDRPWTTHDEVVWSTGLSLSEVRRLNAIVQATPILQAAIVGDGLGHKYWQTILPLARSGALQAAAASSYHWPDRIGVYPGVSCMFYCGFCGRNPEAAYTAESIATGERLFRSIFGGVERHAGASVSFSGGLEPLTNPRIGALVAAAADRGIRVPLITNAFMLTAPYVARQDGLWRLASLRVSLYGVDEPSYVAVTRKPRAYARVIANVIEFLRRRNARGAPVKVGLNFIVLPGTTDQLERLPAVIEEIDAGVDNGPGIDFLTLREDFSVPADRGLSLAERAALPETLARVQQEIGDRRPDLHIDLGYALWTLTLGAVDRPLAMVTSDGMRPRAFPQISVVVDLFGDVYLYREAGFLDRPGAARYRIGRVTDDTGLDAVVSDWLRSGAEILPAADDPALLDAFDHVATLILNRVDADAKLGVGLEDGPVRLA